MSYRIALTASLLLFGCGTITQQPPPPPPPPPSGIGPEGGTINSPDGQASLVIPPNALTGRVDLKLEPVVNPTLDAALYAGASYRVNPAAVSFATPATLTIKTDSAKGPIGTPRQDLVIIQFAGTGTPVSTNPAPVPGTATAKISATGDFQVAWHASAPCTAAERRQFDFWLGHWRFDTPGGVPGDQVVSAESDGCGVRERFSQGTYRGSSVSTRSAAGDWYQTFIDSDRARTVLKGNFAAGSMVLYETPTKRFTWRATSATVVSFFGEETTNGGQTWNRTFDATYTRIP